MRVGVIGCGVVGACVGWHLAHAGAQVLLVDAGVPGAGVSNWSFSWVNASNKTETRAYFDLNVAGLVAHHQLAAELGRGEWWHPTGHLRWSDDPAGAQALRHAADRAQMWGYDVAVWDVPRVRRLLEPDLVFPSDDTEVVFFRDEGWVDGRALVAHLVEDAIEHGAEAHFGCAVTDVVLSGDRVAELIVAGGQRHRVDAVVNAAGPAGAMVADLVGRTLPLRDEPGLVARLSCGRVPLQRAVHAPHVELRPDGPDDPDGGHGPHGRAGRVVLHSREIDAVIDDGADTNDLAMRLQRLAVDVAPALRSAKLIEARVARRPIPLDGFPSVGGVDGLAGYYEAVTHSGITLGVIVGRLLAQEIMDGTVHELMAPYRPARLG